MLHDLIPAGSAPSAVLLAGPTASGKSALALALAERHHGIVINADSMQVYRDLRVLSARPTAAEMARAPHHLYGHVDGAVNYSVGRWREDAAGVLAANEDRQLPIFVGGTGLYFKALERGLAVIPEVPEAIRRAVRAEAEHKPAEALHRQLHPDDAVRLRPSDPQRIQRALEVFRATGRALAYWQAQPHAPPLIDPARALRLFLAPDRATLRDRIDRRFDAMMTEGALDEVRALMARGLDPALPVMRAHGVPGLVAALRGEMSLAAAIEKAKADTRHYARRQVTWFRHQMPGWTALAPEMIRL